MSNVNTANTGVGSPVSPTVTGLSTLASANYATSNAYDVTTNKPLDVILEITLATTNTPSGNKQAVIFLLTSLDNSNYSAANSSGTDTTHDPSMRCAGTIPIPTASVTERAHFSVVAALGWLPPYFKVVVKNDLGVALTSGTVATIEQYATVA